MPGPAHNFIASMKAKIRQLRHTSKAASPALRAASPDPPQLNDTFNTIDLHPPDQPQLTNEKVISVSTSPTVFPIGLTRLDIDKCADIRINAFVEPVPENSVKVHLDTSEDTVLYSAGCTWLEVYTNDRDFQFGTFSTIDDHPTDEPQALTSRMITFTKPFHGKPPIVVVWLNGLHISNSANWRCKAYATDIAPDSFVVHIDTWADTILYSGTVSWIAYPSNRPNIASSSFNTPEVGSEAKNKGTTTFDPEFEYPPRVVAALNWLDIENSANLRLKLTITDVRKEGLTWCLDAWDDTTLHSAGASYIAILDF